MIPYSTPSPPSISERIFHEPEAVFAETLQRFKGKDPEIRYKVACLASYAITTIQTELTGETASWTDFLAAEAAKRNLDTVYVPSPDSREAMDTLRDCAASVRVKRGVKTTERGILQGLLDGTVTIADRR